MLSTARLRTTEKWGIMVRFDWNYRCDYHIPKRAASEIIQVFNLNTGNITHDWKEKVYSFRARYSFYFSVPLSAISCGRNCVKLKCIIYYIIQYLRLCTSNKSTVNLKIVARSPPFHPRKSWVKVKNFREYTSKVKFDSSKNKSLYKLGKSGVMPLNVICIFSNDLTNDNWNIYMKFYVVNNIKLHTQNNINDIACKCNKILRVILSDYIYYYLFRHLIKPFTFKGELLNLVTYFLTVCDVEIRFMTRELIY